MTLADRIAKFEETDRVAYGMIDAEAIAREKKTEKLRQQRMDRDRLNAEEGNPAKNSSRCPV